MITSSQSFLRELDKKLWSAADRLRSVILDRVTNGLAVRMAVLYLCAGARG